MDDNLRAEIAAAKAQADEAAADYEAWQARHATRTKSHQGNTVYKTNWNARPAPAQPQATTMDAETQRRWNEWLDARINPRLDAMLDATGGFVADEVKKLQAQIAALRADLEIVRAHQKAEGNVTPMRGHRDVA